MAIGDGNSRLINLWIDARDADLLTEVAHSKGWSRAELLCRAARDIIASRKQRTPNE